MCALMLPSSLQRPMRGPVRQHRHAPAVPGIRHCKPASAVTPIAAAAEQEISFPSSSAPPAAPPASEAGAGTGTISAAVPPPAATDTTPTAAATDPAVTKRAATGEQTKQRLRKKSNNWRDNQEQGVPSRGLVRITEFSKPAAAAVCVAADLKGPKGLTRVVAVNPSYAGKALQAIRLAGLMLNNQYVWKGANGLEQQQQGDGAAGKQANLGEKPAAAAAVADSGTAATAEATGGRVVMFQPVMVQGVLVNPPELPAGAVAMYTTTVDAGNSVLREVSARRARLQQQQHASTSEAAAASESTAAEDIAAAEATAAPEAGSRSKQGLVGATIRVTWKSTEDKLAYSISNCIQRQGWAVLEVVGNDSTLLIAVKALLKARGLLHNRAKQDAAFTVLDHRTETVTVTGRQKSGTQLPDKADATSEPRAEQTEQQQQQETTDTVPEEQEEESRSTQSATFNLLHRMLLAVRCTKNRPADLVMDSSEVAGSDQQQG